MAAAEPTSSVPPTVEPVLQVNGHALAPFYSEWSLPNGEPGSGDIAGLPDADIVRITLVDAAETFRSLDVRVYDQRPSDAAPLLAEATCSNLHTASRPLFETPPDTVSGPIKLLECDMDRSGTHLAIDVSSLARRCSMLYVVVPVIWWPTDAESWHSEDFSTASWIFSLPTACDPSEVPGTRPA